MAALVWLVGCAPDHPVHEAPPSGPAARYDRGEVVLHGRWPGAPEVGVALAGVGGSPVARVAPSGVGAHVRYERPGVTETWEVAPEGLQQAFVVDEVPSAGPLVLELALRGARASVSEDGRSATFAVAGGGRLRYEGLLAWDAVGEDLPAWMEATDGGLRLVVDAAGAVAPITVDPILPAPTWGAEGGESTAYFGFSVASAGDVNGDGYDDVVVGAPYLDDAVGDAGGASVYLGSAAGLAAAPAWRATSGQSTPLGYGPRYGWAVTSAGDVNGDGFDDVVVGGPSWLDGQGQELGAVALYLGSAGGLQPNPQSLVFGTQRYAWFGQGLARAGDVVRDGFDDVLVASDLAVTLHRGSAAGLQALASWSVPGSAVAAVGDVDGDGFVDVAVGVPSAPGGGRVDLYRGTAAGLAAAAAWTVTSAQSGADFGAAVASAGDVNGDGYADLVVGAPLHDGAQRDEGQVSLYLGSAAGLGPAPAWTAVGGETSAELGVALAPAGDLDGDGRGDVWVGSEARGAGGSVSLYLGSAAGLDGAPAWEVVEDQPNARFGSAVGSAGDVDGDGTPDLVVGAPYYDGGNFEEGAAFAWVAADIDLSDPDGDGVRGILDDCPDAADPLQVDTDGDGVGDACDRPQLSVSTPVTPGARATLTASGVLPGEVVAFGASVGPASAGPCPASLGGLCLDLGPRAIALGQAVAGADGVATLRVTAPLALQPDGPYTVQAAVARGPGGADSVSSPPRVLDGDDLDWDADGLRDAEEAALGTDPTDPDTDADGLGDADELPLFDPLTSDSDGDGALDGADVCWLGDDQGPDADGDAAPDLCDVCRDVADPTQADADRDGLGDACEGQVLAGPLSVFGANSTHWSLYGYAVGSAGDVNGDGFDDVVVGQPGTFNEVSGRAYVFHGSAAGLSGAPAWNQAGPRRFEDGFGAAVASAGDVNGDGFDDVLVGEPVSYTYLTHDPAAWLYLGSAAGLATQATWSALRPNDSDWGSWVAAAGDLDADGYGDVLVGNGRDEVELYRGGPNGPRSPALWSSSTYGLGGSAGDLNGDGYGDLWLAERPWFGEGSTAVFLGGPRLPAGPWWSTVVEGPCAGVGDVNGDGFDDLVGGGALRLGSPTELVAAPGQELAFDGVVAGAGDVNGDGFDDVLVGDDQYQNGQRGEGAAFLFLGSPGGLGAAPAWQTESNLAGYVEEDPLAGGTWFQVTGYGSAVASAGDVDGDGLADVVIGAPYAGNDRGGLALVFGGRAP